MSKQVLVVDDDISVVDILTTALARSGFSVMVAESGNAALERARTEKLDLIILDIMLPGISGKEVIKELKRKGSTERIPIIILTAVADEIDRILGLELGADDYVTKPFNIEELILRCKRVIGANYRLV
jgi:two-component system, OmpR family, alkaline phosphatase synthesis response regulator PhoP